MAEELKACRYRVEKTGYGFWPYCVRAGDGTRELFKGHQKQCMVVAAELETAFEDGKFVADRAMQGQGGEAVEVVATVEAYGGKWAGIHWGECIGSTEDPERQLMTVAQHQRILAAATHPADQVADDLTMVKVSRELLEDLRDCANECYNHARMRGTSGLEHYENLTEQADALLAKSEGLKP